MSRPLKDFWIVFVICPWVVPVHHKLSHVYSKTTFVTCSCWAANHLSFSPSKSPYLFGSRWSLQDSISESIGILGCKSRTHLPAIFESSDYSSCFGNTDLAVDSYSKSSKNAGLFWGHLEVRLYFSLGSLVYPCPTFLRAYLFGSSCSVEWYASLYEPW